MNFRLVNIIIFLLSITSAYSQTQYSPIEISKLMFEADSFPNRSQYLTGELDSTLNKNGPPENSLYSYRLEKKNGKKATVLLTVVIPETDTLDAKIYFERTDTWKAFAIRPIRKSGVFYSVLQELESMSQSELDSMFKACQEDTTKHCMFRNQEEYDYEIEKIKMMLKNDIELKEYFEEHREDFEKLKDSVLVAYKDFVRNDMRDDNFNEGFEEEIRRLKITSIHDGHVNCERCLMFTVGGFLDNTTGFLFVDSEDSIPSVSGHYITSLVPMGGGWYLFTTT